MSAPVRSSAPVDVQAMVLGPVTLRQDARGTWWALNRRDQGWASFGYPYPSVQAALEGLNVELTEHGADEHGPYMMAAPRSCGSQKG